MLPVFLIAILLLVLSAPYGSLLWRRYKMIKEIKKIAVGCGFKVKDLHRFTFFARNKSARYDVLLIGKQRAYSIKLWSAVHADSTLVICSGSSYYVSRGISEPFEQKGRGNYHFRNVRSTAPETRLDLKLRGSREIVPVLLFYPEYKRVIRRTGRDFFVYEQGDEIFGKKMYSPEGFKRLVFEEAEALHTTNTEI